MTTTTPPAESVETFTVPPELAAALVDFQASAPTITKTRTALIPTKSGGSYSYKYADLSDIWDAIREPLKVNQLAVTQSLSGGAGSGLLGLTTTVLHRSGQCRADTVQLDVANRTPQEVGSLITYFKRYALSAVLGLVTEDDDDGAAASRRSRADAPEEPPNPALVAEVEAANAARVELLAATEPYGWTEEKLVRRYWDDYAKNLRNTRDVAMIRGFSEGLVAEAVAQTRDEAEGDVAAEPQGDGPGEDPGEGVGGPEPITKTMLTRLHTVLTNVVGITTREDHLNWCSIAVGRELDSTKDLSKEEGARLITKAEQAKKQQSPEPT